MERGDQGLAETEGSHSTGNLLFRLSYHQSALGGFSCPELELELLGLKQKLMNLTTLLIDKNRTWTEQVGGWRTRGEGTSRAMKEVVKEFVLTDPATVVVERLRWAWPAGREEREGRARTCWPRSTSRLTCWKLLARIME